MIRKNFGNMMEYPRVGGNLSVFFKTIVATSSLILFVCTTSLTAGIINHFITQAHRSGAGVVSMMLDVYCCGNIVLWILVEATFGFLLAGSLTALLSTIFFRPRQ
jgi:uncharacterized membrane protein